MAKNTSEIGTYDCIIDSKDRTDVDMKQVREQLTLLIDGKLTDDEFVDWYQQEYGEVEKA